MKCILLLLLIISCNLKKQDCASLPNHYSSYNQAISLIKNAKFKISENVNTSKSSWVQSANYYSCNGLTGFFIFKTHSKEYVYQDVPIEVWDGFKNAASFGKYYDANIKHRYQLYPN